MRRQKNIGQDVDGHRQMLIHDLGIVGGRFLGGEGVHLTAQGVHLDGDVLGTSPRRTLKEHMFDEVRDAAELCRLVP